MTKLYKWIFIFVAVLLSLVVTNFLRRDYSAIRTGDILTWNGVVYEPATGAYEEGKIITRTGGGWEIRAVGKDKDRNFIVIRSFLDNYLLVRKDYEIPASGKVTAVYIKGEKIEDVSFCNVIEKMVLELDDADRFFYKTDQSSLYGDASLIHLSYEGCPVGTENVGFIGFIENQWVHIPFEFMENEKHESVILCRPIDDVYIPDIEKYVSKPSESNSSIK